MPNYYNPYNFYPVQYANQIGYSGMPSQQIVPMASQPSIAQPQLKAMEWVEGEVGAKAFQMPQGWPANQPIVLWDSTDTIIWLKSWGPMGIPNPMQKLKYVMPEQQSQSYLMSGANEGNTASNASMDSNPDMKNFATKDDITSLREEIRQLSMRGMSRSMNQNNAVNQNGSGNTGNPNTQGGTNRGGNQ